MWGPLSRSENQNGGLPAIESRVKHLTDAKRVSAFRNGGGQPRRGESRRHCFFCAQLVDPIVLSALAFLSHPYSVRVTLWESSAGPIGSPLFVSKAATGSLLLHLATTLTISSHNNIITLHHAACAHVSALNQSRSITWL